VAGSISKFNSGGVTTATTIPTSWAAGSATAGRQLALFTGASNIISATPAGWAQQASAINVADVKLYTRTADGTAADTPTLAVGSCSARWLLLEISGVSAFNAVGTPVYVGSGATTSGPVSATPASSPWFGLAFVESQSGNATTWPGATPSWTNSFVDAGLQTKQNGAGGVNDAQQLNVATLSGTGLSSVSTTVSNLDTGFQTSVVVLFTESGAAAASMLPANPSQQMLLQLLAR
jgi:hypothetical protein